jgi:hypothetical protein
MLPRTAKDFEFLGSSYLAKASSYETIKGKRARNAAEATRHTRVKTKEERPNQSVNKTCWVQRELCGCASAPYTESTVAFASAITLAPKAASTF